MMPQKMHDKPCRPARQHYGIDRVDADIRPPLSRQQYHDWFAELMEVKNAITPDWAPLLVAARPRPIRRCAECLTRMLTLTRPPQALRTVTCVRPCWIDGRYKS